MPVKKTISPGLSPSSTPSTDDISSMDDDEVDSHLEELVRRKRNGRGRPTNASKGLPMRSSSNGGGYYEMKKLREIHHRIIAMHFADPSLSFDEIASTIDKTPQMVRYTINSKLAQEKLALMRGEIEADAIDLKEHLQALGPLAISALEEELSTSAGNVRLRAVETVLNHLVTKAGVQDHSIHELRVTTDDLDKMMEIVNKQRAKISSRDGEETFIDIEAVYEVDE